ncbi:hypothetical protein GE09DRAFT_1231636 [Coniochaeta sp. 2T2.1]|nr:hypothetical protein GE09DRAFT_1231636 [Coniochaeta sp. 2T2.1]
MTWALKPRQRETTIVTLLKEAGAVFYVKTNVPTAMMFSETVNNCYGRTANPFNRTLTPFPTGLRADEELGGKVVGRKALSNVDTVIQQEYDPRDVHGMSISLQLTARRLQEEKFLAMVGRIEQYLAL